MLDYSTLVEMGECASKQTYLRCPVAQKIKPSLCRVFFPLLFKRFGHNLQNESKFETTSCFIVGKMTFNERIFCAVCLWKAI